MYLPLYDDEKQNEKNILLRIPFRRVAVATVSLPLVAFATCVLLSLYKDFESSTSTHCHVANFLPSVSAAIGAYRPQSTIWMAAIGTHALPRYLVTAMYAAYFRSILTAEARTLGALACLLNAAEVSALIGLSFWNSTEHYPVHKTCFMTFVFASEAYMVASCALLRRHRRTAPTELERRSLRLKTRFFFVNVVSFLAAAYFFTRHNNYCEPMVYTWFAAAEYIVILTNMGFHMTACYDFVDKEIVFKHTGVSIR